VITIWQRFLAEALRRIIDKSAASTAAAKRAHQTEASKKKLPVTTGAAKDADDMELAAPEEEEDESVYDELLGVFSLPRPLLILALCSCFSFRPSLSLSLFLSLAASAPSFHPDDTQVSETIGTVTRIQQFRDEIDGPGSAAAGRSRRVLGMLHLYAGHGEEAQQELERAFTVFRDLSGEECAECVAIQEDMKKYL
jgi:hypothetical protein